MTDHAARIRPALMAIASDADMPRSARLAAADAEGAQDVEAVMARTATAIVALESAAKLATDRAKDLRESLLALMVDTGAPSLATATHTIGYAETRRVVVTNPAAIPPHLMDQPPPRPDTAAIGSILRAGGDVAGAALTNGAPALFIRARNKK